MIPERITRGMKQFSSVNYPEIIEILRTGGVGILRTDTLYGLVASAHNESAVRRVYELKGRDDDKSPIVLIGSSNDIFDTISQSHQDYIGEVWPGPVSVILPSLRAPSWIRRGNDSVAYRVPANDELRTFLLETGPLIAPSANPQGMQPAMNIQEARYYFADKVDFYVDGGSVENPKPSQLIRLHDDGVEQLR